MSYKGMAQGESIEKNNECALFKDVVPMAQESKISF